MNDAASVVCDDCHRRRDDDGKRSLHDLSGFQRGNGAAAAAVPSILSAKTPAPSPAPSLPPAAALPQNVPSAPMPALSAFETSRPFTIDTSGQPHLADGEVVRVQKSGVDVYDGEAKAHGAVGGTLLVTSARILWLNAPRSMRLSWALALIRSAGGEEGGLFQSRSHKIVCSLSACGGGGRPDYIRFGFKDGGRDLCLKALCEALERRQPVSASSSASLNASQAPPLLAVGAREATRQKDEAERVQQRALAATAFSGLAALAAHAKDILLLAEQTAAELRAARERRGDVAGAAEEAAVAELLADLGAVGSPVTRTSAGRAYIDALARQVCEFSRPRLIASGGILPITDVYCAYNRGRGVDLVSPEDLLAALERAPRLQLGMVMRQVSLGKTPTRVLALDDMADDKIAIRMKDFILSHGIHASVSQLELATAWKVPLGVAAAHIRVAEGAGAIVRDESVAGTRYFVNRFIRG